MQQPMENPAMQAEALKGMGRGPDTQLMHVTDSEVNALNGLSGLVFNEPLRTNPETGVPWPRFPPPRCGVHSIPRLGLRREWP